MKQILTENAKEKLSKLNINNIDDLISYYPFRYDVLSKSDISNLKEGDKIILDGIAETIPNVYFINKKMNKMTFRFNGEGHLFNVVIFNRAYLKKNIKPGTEIIIIGKYDQKHNLIIANDIKFGTLTKTIIEPIYHSNYSISSKQIHKYIMKFLDNINVEDYIPDYLNNKYNFMNKKEAINIIHNPSNLNMLNKALNKLKYEELFIFMIRMNTLKMMQGFKTGVSRYADYSKVQEFIENLPFKLTEDQKKCINEIYNDLISPKRMNRLLQGDVGSGKTIISFIALYINYLGGFQGALMAPTEILARQHYNNIKKLLPKLNIELLIGKTKTKERNEILEKLKSKEINIIIGTHALFTEDVVYNNLGLVITDEQHRFGVNQRSNLRTKGVLPDVLYMSATPIPRTYALTLYGDMDISNIKTLPNGRKKIKTYVKKETEIKEALEKMFIELKKGHQIYVIAPLVEDSETIDLKSTFELEEKMNRAFGKYFKIGVIHGKLKNKEKEEIMKKFKDNEIQILISTTVIEVGIDVRNATMMVIFDAYRFGLSTLHQLRGRVGRSELESYCILISNKETKRLEILKQTTDGFKISEEDFKLRGSGDLFGVKQSGDMSFKLADIKKDFDMLLKAKNDSIEFLNNKFSDEKYIKIKELGNKTADLD